MSTSPIEACCLVTLVKYEFSFSKCVSIGAAAADLVSRSKSRRRRKRRRSVGGASSKRQKLQQQW